MLLCAQPVAASPRSEADLTGRYAGLGPVGAVTQTEGTWDGEFGVEVTFADVNEHRLVSALAIAVGAMQFTERRGGRLWLDVMAGMRFPMGGVIGVGAGPLVEVDKVRVPRWGGHATLWLYAGVMPFVRVARVQRTGTSFEIGLRIILPAYRW